VRRRHGARAADHSGDGTERPALPRPGGDPMTAQAVTARTGVGVAGRFRGSRIFVHAATILILTAWLLPTLGMLVNSLRPADDVTRSAWWTALSPTARFTTDNYVH